MYSTLKTSKIVSINGRLQAKVSCTDTEGYGTVVEILVSQDVPIQEDVTISLDKKISSVEEWEELSEYLQKRKGDIDSIILFLNDNVPVSKLKSKTKQEQDGV